MRTIWRLLKEYALVLVVIIVAGAVTESCAVLRTEPQEPVLPQCVQPIRLMPNWVEGRYTVQLRHA